MSRGPCVTTLVMSTPSAGGAYPGSAQYLSGTAPLGQGYFTDISGSLVDSQMRLEPRRGGEELEGNKVFGEHPEFDALVQEGVQCESAPLVLGLCGDLRWGPLHYIHCDVVVAGIGKPHLRLRLWAGGALPESQR